MCKTSLHMYHKLSSSEDKLRMRPDFHVNSAPCEYSANVSAVKANANRMTHTSKLSFSDAFDGASHYTTTYMKTTQPHKYNDSMYETTLVDFKCIKSDSSVKALINQLVDNGLNRFAGQTAVRKLFKLLNMSGSGAMSHSELKSSLHLIGIWPQNESNYDELYTMLAGNLNNDITYMSFKSFMDEQCEFSAIIKK